MYRRQGDILVKTIESLPSDLIEKKDGVILLGESTGHKHALKGGKVLLDRNQVMYLSIAKKGSIAHEEHKPINLPKGNYVVIRQREYVMADMTKVVVD